MAEKCIGGRFSLSVEGSRRRRRLLRLSISELSDEGDLRRRFGDLGDLGEGLGALAFLGGTGAGGGVGGGVGGAGTGTGTGTAAGTGAAAGTAGTGTATGGLGLFKLPLGRPAFRFSGRASIY